MVMILVYEIMLDRFLRACLVFLFSTLEACKSTARGKPEGRNPGLGSFNIKSTLKGCKNKNIAMGIEIPSGLLNRLEAVRSCVFFGRRNLSYFVVLNALLKPLEFVQFYAEVAFAFTVQRRDSAKAHGMRMPSCSRNCGTC